jgi:hypothetical protein
MRRMTGILAVAIAVIAVAIFAAQPRAGDTPVVIELFTSQGCSSCPSADELLRRIARDPKLRGRVIPLAYHVDYWNQLGWRDPFSSREWSQRQGEYVRRMKLDSAYTPQVVINGTRQMVGSNSFAIYRAIEEESQRRTEARVTIAADGTIRAESKTPAQLIVVTYEDGIVTKITRGENAGRTQTNDAIVRTLTRVALVNGVATHRVNVNGKLSVAAFLQDPATLRILAAAGAAT